MLSFVSDHSLLQTHNILAQGSALLQSASSVAALAEEDGWGPIPAEWLKPQEGRLAYDEVIDRVVFLVENQDCIVALREYGLAINIRLTLPLILSAIESA